MVYLENKKEQNLLQCEEEWLEEMLSVEFRGKEIILKQLKNSEFIRDYNIGYISLKFNVDRDIEKFPFEIRVPIEMRVFEEHGIPKLFLLHIIDGFISELEIFNADSSPINNNFSIKNKQIIIDKALKNFL